MKNLHKTGLRLWSAQCSTPPDSGGRYRASVTSHVIAESVELAVQALNEAFPGATIHSIVASQHIGHLILTDGACTAIIEP